MTHPTGNGTHAHIKNINNIDNISGRDILRWLEGVAASSTFLGFRRTPGACPPHRPKSCTWVPLSVEGDAHFDPHT